MFTFQCLHFCRSPRSFCVPNSRSAPSSSLYAYVFDLISFHTYIVRFDSVIQPNEFLPNSNVLGDEREDSKSHPFCEKNYRHSSPFSVLLHNFPVAFISLYFYTYFIWFCLHISLEFYAMSIYLRFTWISFLILKATRKLHTHWKYIDAVDLCICE